MIPIHVRPGQDRHYPMIDGDHIAKAAVQDALGAFEVFEVAAHAAPMAPPHVSPWSGVLFVLEGRITALVDGTPYDVEPGGLVVFPAGTPSTFEVVGESARFLGITTGDGAGRFFADFADRSSGPTGKGLDGDDPLGHAASRCPARGCVSRMEFEVTTRATPEQVREALTDFSDRRLQTWNRTLDPRTCEVHALGDTWAVAREGTAGSPFWVVSRYDWSDPTMIRTTVEESSWGGSGTGSVRIAPVDGGGSRVHAEWTHTGVSRTRDEVLLSLITSFPMRRMIARLWVKALDRYAQSDLA